MDAGGPSTSSRVKKQDKAAMQIVPRKKRTADLCEELAGHQQPVGYMRMSAAENVGPEKTIPRHVSGQQLPNAQTSSGSRSNRKRYH